MPKVLTPVQASSGLNPRTQPLNVYSEVRRIQKTSTDLVVFSGTAKQVVRIAWPVVQHTQRRVEPSGIRAWLRARGLHWACFCGLTEPAGVKLSCQIVHGRFGRVVAFCHYEPSVCGYFMDLNYIHKRTSSISTYANVQPIGSSIPQDMARERLLTDFALEAMISGAAVPFFSGYAGERAPGVEQMAGQSNASMNWAATKIRKRHPNSGARLIVDDSDDESTDSPNESTEPQAGPSNPGKGKEDDSESRLERQQRMLKRFGAGHGVWESDWVDIAETCDLCGFAFLETLFKKHVAICDGSAPSDSDDE